MSVRRHVLDDVYAEVEAVEPRNEVGRKLMHGGRIWMEV